MISHLIDCIKQSKCKCRIKTSYDNQSSDWDYPVFMPVDGYIETGKLGPVRVDDVEWIEIDPIVATVIGKRLPPQLKDMSDELSVKLDELEIAYSVYDGKIRVHVNAVGPDQ